MSRKTSSRGYQEARLLAAMAEEGCPVCHDTAGSDDRFFFWFFTENYYEAFTLDALTRSLGFCLAHGERLAQTTMGAYQLAAVHEVLVRRILRSLSGPPLPAASASCPACRDRQDLVERSAFMLAGLLQESSGADSYGHPGTLCFPHLQAVASRVSPLTLERLLAIHEAAAASAVRVLEGLRGELGPFPSDGGRDLVKTLLPSLRLAVGHDPGSAIYPPLEGSAPPPGLRDRVGRFLEGLRRTDACAVCLEVRRAWVEWFGWLDEAASRDVTVEDLLPTCLEHVWPTIHQGGAFLAAAAARHVLSAVQGEIHMAATLLKAPPRRDHERPLDRLKRVMKGPRQRVRTARQGLTRPVRCPVCERLAVARDRALSLLFALLEDRQHRAAVESGYGLCLKHFSRALTLDPAPEVRAVVMEVEKAKLARLLWELEESLRKVAWSFRPEAKGAEEEAWRRATLRFSGSFGDEPS